MCQKTRLKRSKKELNTSYELFNGLWDVLPQDGNVPCFLHIAAMHSELICVGDDGKLYQWRWEDPLPYREQGVIYHPRVKALGLMDEKVVSVSASSIRASVLTESGKVR